jgi:hypothetical protein
MGRIKKKETTRSNAFERPHLERQLVNHLKKQTLSGLVTQSAENPTFNRRDGGSSPSGPTTDLLVAKKCSCKRAMHMHRKGDDIIFSGCLPCIVDIKIERTKDGANITGNRSTKRVRCSECNLVHLISGFEKI